MKANPLQNMAPIVKVTGPHPAVSRWNGKPARIWRVFIISAAVQNAKNPTYQCMSYSKAVNLSCNMARDRKLHLHLEALLR